VGKTERWIKRSRWEGRDQAKAPLCVRGRACWPGGITWTPLQSSLAVQ
jgi:hypothetical protein